MHTNTKFVTDSNPLNSNPLNISKNSAQDRKIIFIVGSSGSSIEEERTDTKTDNIENTDTHVEQIPYTYISSYTRPRIGKQVNDFNFNNDNTVENNSISNAANIIPAVTVTMHRISRHQPIKKTFKNQPNQPIIASQPPAVSIRVSNENDGSESRTFFERIKTNPKKTTAIAASTVLALALLAVGITALAYPDKAKELSSAFGKNTIAFAEANFKAITKVINNFFSDPQFNKKLVTGAGVTAGIILLVAIISWKLHREGQKYQNDQTKGCGIIYESTPGIPGTILDGVENLSNKMMSCFRSN